MLLGQVEGFAAIARLGHLGRAATSLYISQPALTSRLRGLEAELGAPLFVRSRRGMALTEAGRAFLPYAMRALDALEGAAGVVRELALGVAGELRIGATRAVSTHVLPILLARYVEKHPQVRLSVRTDHSDEVVELVVSDAVDVGLVRSLPDSRVETIAAYDEELVFVASPEHPLAQLGEIGLAAFGDTRLVVIDRTSSYYALTQALFRSAGVRARSVLEVDNMLTTKEMVRHGLGVALMPATAVTADLAASTLVRLAVTDAPMERRHIVAVRRRGPLILPTALAPFLALVREVPSLVPGALPPSDPAARSDGAGRAGDITDGDPRMSWSGQIP